MTRPVTRPATRTRARMRVRTRVGPRGRPSRGHRRVPAQDVRPIVTDHRWDKGPTLDEGLDEGLEEAVLVLDVGSVAHGGHCIARHEGQVVFVRHALPGERVRAVVTEQRTGFLRADAIEILTPSPHRVEPPCRFAGPGRCGGCDFQHADPAYQRELKAAVVREQLERLGGLTAAEVADLGLVVEPLSEVDGGGLGWRTRVQYTVDSTGRAGLLKHRSHEVVPVDRCLIAHAGVRDATVRGTPVLANHWTGVDAVEVVAAAGGTTVLSRAPLTVVDGPARVTERAVGRDWSLPAEAFWQVHPAAADTLATTVIELLAPRRSDRVWDLYGGTGLFAAALAPHVDGTGRITVVESDPGSVAAARQCLRDLTTVTVVRSDVARALANRAWRAVDLVVLDPPRAGAGTAVAAAVAARGPRAVAYVACDPAAFARDVRAFRTNGYHLARLRGFDLFPQTHHVECVGLLVPSAVREDARS
jgi:tRNA/tmRNA/rRNA uracil-C5-methylase (TrmA/RlmC/RlmD family)